MIKVMVIEDEPPILRSICQKIESINPNFLVSATAGNGQEGIEQIGQMEELDLIFVDINLPVVNGIGVLEYIRTNRPEIMSVVLSGYKDFEYVKHAYEKKTIEYLLKPLKEEELRNVLERVEKIWRQKRITNNVRVLEAALSSPAGSSKQEQRRYFMVLLTMGSYYNSMLGNGIDYGNVLKQLAFEVLLAEFFPSDSYWMVDGKNEMDRIIFIDAGQADAVKKVEEIYGRLKESQIPITVTVNTACREAEEVYASYYEMRNYVENNMIFGRSSLLIYSGLGMDPIFCSEKARVDQALMGCKKNPKAGQIQKELLELLEECVRNPVSQNAVVYMVKRFFSVLCGSIPCNREYVRVEEEIEFILLNPDTFDRMKEQICVLIQECFGLVKVEVKDKELLAGEMKEYLESNYRYGISNQKIAETFGFVPTYLSSIFKEYYQVSLGDYLIHLRIEEAKELLLHSQLKSKEIAEKTGYRDALYFSKAFKKVVGVSPREYVERNGKG